MRNTSVKAFCFELPFCGFLDRAIIKTANTSVRSVWLCVPLLLLACCTARADLLYASLDVQPGFPSIYIQDLSTPTEGDSFSITAYSTAGGQESRTGTIGELYPNAGTFALRGLGAGDEIAVLITEYRII